MKKRLFVLLFVVILVTMTAPNVLAVQKSNLTPAAPHQERSECNEDLSGETVTFYHFGDLSGDFKFITLPLVAGLTDALAYYNENGGLCGATIAIEGMDTGGKSDVTQQAWDDFTSREGTDRPNMILLYGSADGELLREQAAELEIPILLAAGSELALYGADSATPGWIFGVIPLYTDQLGMFCDYISENWEQFGIEGEPAIGHLSWLGAFGGSSNTANSQAYCESKGVSIVGAEGFLPGSSSVAEQLNELVTAGANIIYTTSLATGPVTVAKAITGASLQGKVLLAGPNWALDTSVIGLGGADVNGVVGVLPYKWWDEIEHPGIQLVLNSWLTNRLAPAGDDEAAVNSALATRNIAYLLAFASIDLWVEVMTQTVNRVGYENLTGAAVYETLNAGFDYEALAGVLPIHFDENLRAQSSGRIGQIQFIETGSGVTPSILPISDEEYVAPDLRASVDLGAGGEEGSEEGGEEATEEATEEPEATEESE